MKKWLIWIVILLLVINLAAIVTMLINRQKNVAEETPIQATESASSMKYSGRWFRDELGLTREQMRAFSGFNPVFRQKIRHINIELVEKRRQMLEEMADKNSDTTRLNQLSDSIGMLHSDLKKATYSYYLEFKQICTKEQQDKLKQIFSMMFEGELPAGPGRGMQGRGRSGMRQGQNENL